MSLLAAVCLFHSTLFAPQNQVSELVASEDVWVYPHATDPGADAFLRVFGIGGKSVAPTVADIENFSYGYLKFNLSGIQAGKELVAATLQLTCATKVAIDPASKDWPLEARGLSAVFDEKKFVFENAAKISPTESLYGTGVVTEGEIDKEARIIKINLLDKKSKFSEDVKAYLGNSKPMCLALTSKYDVAEMGMKGIYKVFSKDNKDSVVRPRLILEFK